MQLSQLEVPAAAKNPAPQLAQLAAPISEVLPCAHAKQALSLVWADEGEALPGAHFAQLRAFSREYVPAGQAAHVVEAAKLPAEQVESELSVHSLAPAADVRPAGHSVHALALLAANAPAEQLVQPATPPALAVPAPQPVQTMLPAIDVKRPAAHSVHVAAPDAAVYAPAWQLLHVLAASPEYMPATQLPHWLHPALAWKVPAAQSAQLAAPELAANWPVAQLAHAAAATPDALPGPHGRHAALSARG
jgi:hypothetical protein